MKPWKKHRTSVTNLIRAFSHAVADELGSSLFSLFSLSSPRCLCFITGQVLHVTGITHNTHVPFADVHCLSVLHIDPLKSTTLKRWGWADKETGLNDKWEEAAKKRDVCACMGKTQRLGCILMTSLHPNASAPLTCLLSSFISPPNHRSHPDLCHPSNPPICFDPFISTIFPFYPFFPLLLKCKQHNEANFGVFTQNPKLCWQ